MRVGAVQFKPDKADFAGSLERLGRLAEQAAQHTQLLVLPEMAATGYLFDSPAAARKIAETAQGPTFARLSPIAAAHNTWIVAGFPEIQGDALFNSALVIDPSGALAFTYRKTLLFEADETWARPGDSGYRAFDTEGGRFGVGICMDLNDDGFINWCVGAKLDAIAFPTNWLEEGSEVWGYWAWRIDETGAALVAANTYGWEKTTQFHGRSCILHRRIIHAAAPASGDDILIARLPD